MADLGADDTAIMGFWVLVDPKDEMKLYERTLFDPTKEMTYNTIKVNNGSGLVDHDIEIEQIDNVLTPFSGRLGESTYRVNPPNADKRLTAPQMIVTHYSWHWPREEVNISKAWLKFPDWVKDQSVLWYSTNNGTFSDFHPEQCVMTDTPPWLAW